VTLDAVQIPGCFKLATPPATPKPYPEDFPLPTDVLVHNAYRISWQPSDTPTLTPQPPAVTCDGGISVWVPGSPVTSSACPTHYNDSPISNTTGNFLRIGLPIILVFLIAGCAGTCWYHSRKERRKKRMRAARAAQELNDASVGAPAS
jgi:hypothetical protein